MNASRMLVRSPFAAAACPAKISGRAEPAFVTSLCSANMCVRVTVCAWRREAVCVDARESARDRATHAP